MREWMSGAILAVLAASPAAADGHRKVVLPEDPQARAFFEQYGFAEAVVVGDTVYLSGVVAGHHEGVDDEISFDRTFQYIATVLERAGSDWDHVVDMTTFHTDLPAQIETFSKVKKRYLPEASLAWTAIDIDRLYPDNGIVEIKLVAKVKKAN